MAHTHTKIVWWHRAEVEKRDGKLLYGYAQSRRFFFYSCFLFSPSPPTPPHSNASRCIESPPFCVCVCVVGMLRLALTTFDRYDRRRRRRRRGQVSSLPSYRPPHHQPTSRLPSLSKTLLFNWGDGKWRRQRRFLYIADGLYNIARPNSVVSVQHSRHGTRITQNSFLLSFLLLVRFSSSHLVCVLDTLEFFQLLFLPPLYMWVDVWLTG